MNRYQTNRKFRLKRIRLIYDDMRPFERNEWRRRLDKHWKHWSLPTDYSHNPSYWNHLQSTVPSRRKERDILKKLRIDSDCGDYNWPSYKKPVIYYW